MAHTDTDRVGQSLYSLGTVFFKSGQFSVETESNEELMAIKSLDVDILSSLTMIIPWVHLEKPALHLTGLRL